MNLNKCRFLIGWMDGSDGACGEATGINRGNDLIAGVETNENVNVYEYEAPAGFEWEVGASKAFRDNFTAQDTLSVVQVYLDGAWVEV